MAGSSKGFYMKDGRLFEMVFYNRGGNQDFGLYADDGTDLGRKFYQGVGHHETGYKRSDGVDIGSLLFDNTEPVQGYITSDLASGGTLRYGYSQCGAAGSGAGMRWSWWYTPSTVNLVAHPGRGSGLFSYYWRAWSSNSQAASIRTSSYWSDSNIRGASLRLPVDQCHTQRGLINGLYGLVYSFHEDPIINVNCTINDTLTGNSVATGAVVWSVACHTCVDCDDCGDSP